MANPEHLDILKQGVEAWNMWIKAEAKKWDYKKGDKSRLPKLRHYETLRHTPVKTYSIKVADLSKVDLRGFNDLKGIDFYKTDLGGTDLRSVDLTKAYLRAASLVEANLQETVLSEANISYASLIGANLKKASLCGAQLKGANLSDANLNMASLRKAHLEIIRLNVTIFADVDLEGTHGLDQCDHRGPSTIDHRTLERNTDLPLEFLRGCGLSNLDIEAYRLKNPNLTADQVGDILYRMHDLRVGKALQFYSCFISYSSENSDFAKKLHDDLQDAGVRCWFAPEDLKIGDKFRSKIDEAIRSHERLLLILSKAAIDSGWVEYEANRAHSREMTTKETVLFPVRLDDAILEVDATWADFIRDERHIGDFTDEAQYDESFERLLRDLQEET